MIPRESLLKILVLVFISQTKSLRTYDTSDWTPITNTCPTCYRPQEQENKEVPLLEKRASGRVLHLPEQNTDNYLARPKNSQEQYLRETKSNLPNIGILNEGELPPQYVNQGFYHLRTPNLPPSAPAQVYQSDVQFQSQPKLVQLPIKPTFSQTLQAPYRNFTQYQTGIQTINQAFPGSLQYPQGKQIHITSTQKPDEKESIQLVYVPIESLNERRNEPVTNPLMFQQTPQEKLQQNIQNDFAKQAIEAFKLHRQLQQGQTPVPVPAPAPIPASVPLTEKPLVRKRKPHQPPLAVYMGANKDVSVDDVLNVLKNANSISVQDTVGPNSPQVFIGPKSLQPPEGYAKFDLPYLSTLENNRVERKIDQLPFFVAPLSYKTPNGYSKIPLPAPHVGSVVVSHKEEKIEIPEPQPQAVPIQQNINSLDPHLYQKREKQTQRHRFSTTSLKPPPAPTQTFTPRPDPLSYTINQYELEQINSQFIPEVEYEQGFLTEVAPPQNLRDQEHVPRTQQDHRLQLQQRRQHERLEQERIQQQQQLQRQRQEEERIIKQQRQREQIEERQKAQQLQLQRQRAEEERIRQQEIEERQQAQQQLQRQRQEEERIKQQQIEERQRAQQQQLQRQRQEEERIKQQRIEEQQQSLKEPQQSAENPQIYEHPPVESTQQKLRQRLQQHQQQQYQPIEPLYQFASTTPSNPQYVGFGPVSNNNIRITSPASQLPAQLHYVTGYPLDINNQFVNPTAKAQSQQTGKPTYQDYSRYSLVEEIGEQRIPLTTPQSQFGQSTPQSRSETTIKEEEGTVPPTVESDTKHESEERGRINPAYLQVQDINTFIHNQQEVRPKEEVKTERLRTTTDSDVNISHEPLEYIRTYTELVPVRNNEAKEQTEKYQLPERLSINPQLPTLINGLQDQALRPLLVPASIAPTTEQVPQHVQNTQYIYNPEQYLEKETTILPEYEEVVTTPASTTPYRGRTRGRGQRTRPTTTTSSPRRNIQRTRRPTSKPKAETSKYQGEQSIDSLSVVNDYSTEVPRNRQRFRTRTKSTPTTSEIPQPNSYMQFDQPVVQTALPREYHSSGTEVPITEPPSTKRIALPEKLNVDVVITHPITEPDKKEVILISKPDQHPQYVIFNPAIETAEALEQRQSTTKPPRIRTRGRTKSRYSSSTSTSTTTQATTVKEETTDPPEFYGFFRPPQFPKPNVQTQQPITTKLYSSTYISTPPSFVVYNPNVHYEDQPVNPNTIQVYSDSAIESSTPTTVNFVGQIRPKYSPTTINHLDVEEQTEPTTTERRIRTTKSTTKPRIRGRVTLAPRRNTSPEDVSTTNTIRYRSRGKSHFKPPHVDKERDTSADEDVEGGNYPAPYLRAKLATEKPKFQITIAPNEEELEDQLPYSSINRPRILPQNANKEDEGIYQSNNSIESERRSSTPEPSTEKLVVTTEEEELTTERQKKKGYWKLVKQRPVDHFEGAESQFVSSVINSVPDTMIKDFKAKEQMKETTTVKNQENSNDPNFFDSLYQIFGMDEVHGDKYSSTERIGKEEEIKTDKPEIEDDFVEVTTEVPTTEIPLIETTQITINATQEDDNQIVKSPKPDEVYDPWMGLVKTSTSTEVSHETEICYRGKCIKSKGVHPSLT